jgi:hypothetical protein
LGFAGPVAVDVDAEQFEHLPVFAKPFRGKTPALLLQKLGDDHCDVGHGWFHIRVSHQAGTSSIRDAIPAIVSIAVARSVFAAEAETVGRIDSSFHRRRCTRARKVLSPERAY